MTPAERPIEIAKAKVASRKPSAVSLMPEGLVDDLSQTQLADLLAFLLADATAIGAVPFPVED